MCCRLMADQIQIRFSPGSCHLVPMHIGKGETRQIPKGINNVIFQSSRAHQYCPITEWFGMILVDIRAWKTKRWKQPTPARRRVHKMTSLTYPIWCPQGPEEFQAHSAGAQESTDQQTFVRSWHLHIFQLLNWRTVERKNLQDTTFLSTFS